MAELCSKCTRNAIGLCAGCLQNLCDYHRGHEAGGRQFVLLDYWCHAHVPPHWALPESWEAAKAVMEDGSTIMHLDCRTVAALAAGERMEATAPSTARTWLLRGMLTPEEVARQLERADVPTDCQLVEYKRGTRGLRFWRETPREIVVKETFWMLNMTITGTYSGGVEPGRSGHYGGYMGKPGGHALTRGGIVVDFEGVPDAIHTVKPARPVVQRSSFNDMDSLYVAEYLDALSGLADRAGARPAKGAQPRFPSSVW